MQKLTAIILTITMFALVAPGFSMHAAKKEKPFVVVIDAGHGGKDAGAVDNNVREKDINLATALKLGSLISKKLKNVKVVYTREDDRFLTLQERADIANKAKGDLFISIHTNSLDHSNKNRTTVGGSSVYVLGLHKDEANSEVARRENSVISLEKNQEEYAGFDPDSDESYIIFEMAQKGNLSKSCRFADDVQKQLVSVAKRADRGVHQAGFWVLWSTSMPAVLVELDFICNPNSARYIASTQGQEQMAEAMFNAVRNYHESYKAELAGLSAPAPTEGFANLPAATPAPEKTVIHKETAKAASQSGTARKRRSRVAREASDSRDFEDANLVLKSEAAAAPMVMEASVADEPEEAEQPAKSPKKEAKKKEPKKEQPKKEARKEPAKSGYRVVATVPAREQKALLDKASNSKTIEKKTETKTHTTSDLEKADAGSGQHQPATRKSRFSSKS